MGFANKRYESIQMLRGIAAMSVVLNHIAFIGRGGFGVDIFFCISGFIMMYVTEESTKHFFSKRLIRVLPLYYVITGMTVIAMKVLPGLFDRGTLRTAKIIKTFLFLPYRNHGELQPVVRVGWTLNYEMFFYLVLFLAILISKRYRGLIASAVMIILSVCGQLFTVRNVYYRFYTNSIILEFVLGILAFYVLKKCEGYYCELKGSYKTAAGVLGCILFALMWVISFTGVPSLYDRVVVYGILGFLVFVSAFVYGYNKKIWPPLVWLGDISFSLYLIHYFIIRGYNKIMVPDGKMTVINFLVMIPVIALVLFISYMSYNFFEKKLNNKLRKLFKI